MIEIERLIITQDGLRDLPQLDGMIDYVRRGGKFDDFALTHYSEMTDGIKPPMIRVCYFKDDPKMNIYIEDGHHRIASCVLGGRNFLFQSEYIVNSWKSYRDYLDINFEANWLTPYDPRTEVRCADYREFKKQVYNCLNVSKDAAINYIRKMESTYKCPRRYKTVKEFIADLGLQR